MENQRTSVGLEGEDFDEIQRILEEFDEAWRSGTPPPIDAVLGEIDSELKAESSGKPEKPLRTGTGPTLRMGAPLFCPHCHAMITPEVEDWPAEITCPACGNRFSIAADAETNQRSATPPRA